MNPYAQQLVPDGLVIFLLHGVVRRHTARLRNYLRKHLDEAYFRAFLEAVLRVGAPVSMDDLIVHHREATPLPPRAFAITFDDGFENNYSVAAPILAELNVPATFYVSTQFVSDNLMSWTDRLEFCLERVEHGQLRFPWADTLHTFSSDADKIRVLDHVRTVVKADASMDYDAVVRSVYQQCGLAEVQTSDDPLDRKMNWAQVRELGGSTLFSVGGHTHRHVVMSSLGRAELDREIKTSLDLLGHHAAVGPRHYSYPEGMAHCYSDLVIERLKAHGVECCPTAQPGANHSSDDLFHLRRVNVS